MVIGLLFILLFTAAATAQDGSFDTGFGTGGKVYTKIGTREEYGNAIAVQSNGAIVVAGTYYAASIITRPFIVRYLENGTLDNSFSGDGRVTAAVGTGSDILSAVAVQPDGRIIGAGTAIVNDLERFLVLRFNADGTPDHSFDGDGAVVMLMGEKYNDVKTVTLQSDGKILVGGKAFKNDTTYMTTLRLMPNGAPDSAFGTGGAVMTAFSAAFNQMTRLFVLPDGRIVAAGSVYANNKGELALARYMPDGALDTSFSGDGKLVTDSGPLDLTPGSAAVQPDGKIILAGSSYLSADYDFILYRFSADGTPDTGFDGDGLLTTPVGGNYDFLNGVTLQPDGKILAVGSCFNGTNYDFGIVRYLTNGTPDPSFDGDGKRVFPLLSGSEQAKDVALQADGKILIAGEAALSASDNDLAVVRLNNTVLTAAEDRDGSVPSVLSLGQNYPNPFNPETTLRFTVPSPGHITLSVYDLLGREVAVLMNGRAETGTHAVRFNGAGLASGLYLARLSDGNAVHLRKMQLMK